MARILVAEDDESMRSFLAGALRRAGHMVETAGDGFEAITFLARQEFDVLLADVVMP
ncbi:MAG: response regulator transcription factor, partial [Dongiaceae bacterium]